MNRFSGFAAAALALALAVGGVSCSSKEKKPAAETNTAPADKSKASTPAGDSTTSIKLTEGEAGGVIESTFTATATVAAIDAPTRSITLQVPNGSKATFRAPAEMRNFDQLQVGDKVNATFAERLEVLVNRSGAAPSAVRAADIASAPKGAKPGAIVAEAYELVATVKSIDTAKRTAVLAFVGDEMRTLNVRPDVDLSRYKVGDTVIIRASSTLMVVVEQP